MANEADSTRVSKAQVAEKVKNVFNRRALHFGNEGAERKDAREAKKRSSEKLPKRNSEAACHRAPFGITNGFFACRWADRHRILTHV